MIVVTGGAGFLGRHLSRRLHREGNKVLVVDNHLTSDPRHSQDLAREGIRFLRHDVVDPLPIIETQAVYHLASPASPKDYDRMPVETLRTGAEGTRNALELARRADATFLLASTSEVYGEPQVHPQPETYHGNVS
ncbi:MAG TPA: NAD-dependent epimerase/dehydratase family protein, partial [Candidatus Thermoplasmatota archaeon]|nr:NAD-dependent epimerase/dehydratase family protein [Candidatus Thermoplasmatota archaeon]